MFCVVIYLDGPTVVHVNIFVRSISKIDDVTMVSETLKIYRTIWVSFNYFLEHRVYFLLQWLDIPTLLFCLYFLSLYGSYSSEQWSCIFLSPKFGLLFVFIRRISPLHFVNESSYLSIISFFNFIRIQFSLLSTDL